MANFLWLLPLTAFPATMILHVLAARFFPLRQRGVGFLGALTAALVGTAGAHFGGGGGLPVVYFFGASALYSYVYFHFFNMAFTARRIHLLVLAYRGEKDAGQYHPRTLLTMRLDRLVAVGALTRSGGRIVLRRSPLLWAAEGVARLRRVFYRSGA